MKLQLKFRKGTSAAHREKVIAKATKAGATAVRPLFPEDSDVDLSALYIVDVGEPKRHKAVRFALAGEPDVEFVEDEVERKLTTAPARRL